LSQSVKPSSLAVFPSRPSGHPPKLKSLPSYKLDHPHLAHIALPPPKSDHIPRRVSSRSGRMGRVPRLRCTLSWRREVSRMIVIMSWCRGHSKSFLASLRCRYRDPSQTTGFSASLARRLIKRLDGNNLELLEGVY
jgi:hypothetical protein